MLLWLVATITIGLLGYWLYSELQRGQTPGSIPGPLGLPLVGYLPFLTTKPYLKFRELAETYGPVFQLKIGHRSVVILGNRDMMRDAYLNDSAFAGRPLLPNYQILSNESYNGGRFAFRTGDWKWKYLRKVSLKALSLFASSRNSRLESVVLQASDTLEEDFLSHKGKPFNPKPSIFATVAGVIGAINFGIQYDPQDGNLIKMIQINEHVTEAIGLGSFADYLPLGKVLFAHKLREFEARLQPLFTVVHALIDSHPPNEAGVVADVADALAEMAKENDPKTSGITNGEIKGIPNDLFAAGFVTTMETTRWLLALLAKHPQCQRKVQQELLQTLGENNKATLGDKEKLPYCEAVLLETFRFSSMIPLGLPHSVMTDTELHGFKLKQGTIVFANHYAIHHDPLTFPDPDTFQPERFLKSNGEVNMDMAQLIVPFGTGKRRCVGENLARQELFLLMAHLFQKFTFKEDPTDPIDFSKVSKGFARFIHPYKIIAEPIISQH